MRQAYIYFCRGILIALHTVQRIFRSIKGELGGVVTTIHEQMSAFQCNCMLRIYHLQEPLTHVHDRLNRRSGSSFVDN